MDPYLILALIAVLFALVVMGMGFLRRERSPLRQAGEALLWGGILLGVAWALRMSSPIVYLAAFYVVARRSRLLVDLANAVAGRGRAALAGHLYDLAQRLALNPADRVVVMVNRGAALLFAGQMGEAAALLESLLAGPALGDRLEAACRCNLGLAYLRQGRGEQAREQFVQTIDLLPTSSFAQRARIALQRLTAAPQT